MKYRPEIDGLRGIAVIAVIIYHARFTFENNLLLPGGFLGVDIFFIISGFLITTIILSQQQNLHGFSFGYFYQRRIRRLIPALLTVLAFCIPFAWHFLYPSELVRFAGSELASAFFVANIFWYHILTVYSAPSGLYMPLLHTWSLGVEEQFYLFFPAMLVFIVRYVKKYLYVILMVLIFVSFICSVWVSREIQGFAYFMLFTRFWELMMGAVLAVFMLNKSRSKRNVLSFFGLMIGFVVIIVSFVFVSLNDNHPGFITLPVLLGTVLIIYFAYNGNIIVRILSSRLVVYIGLISYSLYLWHYPVLVFGRFYFGNLEKLYLKLLCLLIICVLSVMSYHFIESPFRNQKKISIKKLFAIFFALFLLILIFCGYVYYADGAEFRYKNLTKMYGANEFDGYKLREESWLKFFNKVDDIQAERGFSTIYAKNKVLIVGDSQAKDLFNAFYLNKKLYPNADFAYFRLQDNYFYRNDYRIKVYDLRLRQLFGSKEYRLANYVLFAYGYKSNNIGRISSMMKVVISDGKTPILSSTNQGFINRNKDLKYVTIYDTYVLRHQAMWSIQKINNRYARRRYNKDKDFNTHLRKLAEKYRLLFIDRHKVVCVDAKKTCYGLTETGKKTYYDHVHWTLAGATFFGKKIAKLVPFSSVYEKNN